MNDPGRLAHKREKPPWPNPAEVVLGPCSVLESADRTQMRAVRITFDGVRPALTLCLSLVSACDSFHLLAQTEWPHIRPHLFDVGQAFLLKAALPCVTPTERVLSIGRPD